MSSTGSLSVRTITAADSEAVIRMWAEFARYLRGLGDTDDQAFGRDAFLRDGFGPDPAFSGIIAERDGAAVGYLLYHFGYDVDRGARILFIVDLWVDTAARRGGVGRALMREAAARCRAKGGIDLAWAVFKPNKLAMAFYEGLGAEYVDTLSFMHIAADRL